MNHHQLHAKLGEAIQRERQQTNEVLKLINIGLGTRAYLELGFSSMFDWLVKGFGYSHSAAYRRIEAAKLLKAVPEVSQKLESGNLNLSTLCKTQTSIRAQEKVSGERVSEQAKIDILKEVENKSVREAEQVLIAHFPETKSTRHQERRMVIDAQTTRLSMNLSKEAMTNLERAKQVLSHKFPNATDSEIVAHALSFLLEKTDLLRDSPSAAASKRVTKSGRIRTIFKESQGKCTYRDPVTGRICGSRYQLQVDHIVPRALGGSDSPENLRVLCRKHNLLAAEKMFGRELMDKFRVQT